MYTFVYIGTFIYLTTKQENFVGIPWTKITTCITSRPETPYYFSDHRQAKQALQEKREQEKRERDKELLEKSKKASLEQIDTQKTEQNEVNFNNSNTLLKTEAKALEAQELQVNKTFDFSKNDRLNLQLFRHIHVLQLRNRKNNLGADNAINLPSTFSPNAKKLSPAKFKNKRLTLSVDLASDRLELQPKNLLLRKTILEQPALKDYYVNKNNNELFLTSQALLTFLIILKKFKAFQKVKQFFSKAKGTLRSGYNDLKKQFQNILYFSRLALNQQPSYLLVGRQGHAPTQGFSYEKFIYYTSVLLGQIVVFFMAVYFPTSLESMLVLLIPNLFILYCLAFTKGYAENLDKKTINYQKAVLIFSAISYYSVCFKIDSWWGSAALVVISQALTLPSLLKIASFTINPF